MSLLTQEIERRRTFAIIAHPDAGKTTLTEKLLLYGGAIRQAGSVRARKAEHHAVSDWMEIEKQRGISVTSSVMAFDFDGYRINILDTPGHQDFSEDTYRTLVAADSAVMLIDGAKGVEEQTVKLFHVCRMRGIPIFTFVNKMDRASRDPFDLVDEIERVLGIAVCPVSWPIGIHGDFQGVYFSDEKAVELYAGKAHGSQRAEATCIPLADPRLADALDEPYIQRLRSEIELFEGAGAPLDLDLVRAGKQSPMFFGSAMNNFGVEPFLRRFLGYTTPPAVHTAQEGEVAPWREQFSGFVFKIQANMNPAHRDRIAFLRICSGTFTRGMEVWHSGTGKPVKLAQPQQFMADERTMVEQAYPGDIIGLFDPGLYRLGDTLCEGPPLHFAGIPMFAPEQFMRVSAMDSLKRKQFVKGIDQLCEEGAVQVFRRPGAGREEHFIGAVGALQFDVLRYRLQFEYGVELRMEPLPYRFVRWISGVPPDGLRLSSSTTPAVDRLERPVLLFENEWSMRWAVENNKGLELLDIS